MHLRSSSLYRDYPYPFSFIKSRRTPLELNCWDPYPSSEREIIFRRRLFTFSIKCNIKQFHVVVMQKRQRNLQKIWCTCKGVVLPSKPFCFFFCLTPSFSCLFVYIVKGLLKLWVTSAKALTLWNAFWCTNQWSSLTREENMLVMSSRTAA